VNKQRGEGELFLLFCIIGALLLFCVVGLLSESHHRTKHHATLVKTHDHRILVRSENGSWWAYVAKAAEKVELPDIELPTPGSDSFKLPPGTWQKAEAPRLSEIEEEEEATVEEMDSGEPSEDASGDIGADSDGNAGVGDADGGGDAGGDGGDGGGGE
jgi:hypothetical protein